MNCPKCQGEKSIVMETRRSEGSTWRRRCCRGCGRNFVTQEVAAEQMPNYRPERRVTDARDKSQFKTHHLAGIWK